MEKVILELYERSLQYNNRSDSIYWIYSIESKIVRRNNIMKRFLTVRFFNRMMNENNNLMRIYLKVNDEEIKADQFVISKQYQNKNILGFAIERDLEDESVNVEITGYIIDGKKVELSEEYIQDIDINLDQEKLNVLQQLYKDNKVIVVPTIHENYWICSCGYYNKKISKLCLSCGTSINTINQMLNSKNTDLLDNIISQIKVSLDEDIEETIENFSQKLNSQYGIDKNTVLQYIDVNQLNIEQEKIKNKTIHEYIESHPVLFSDQISFDDNIDKYCQGLDFKTIHKDDVKKCLELDRLKQEYDTYCQKKQKRKKLTKRGLIISLVICIMIVGGYAGKYVYNHYFREYNQVTILNTLENRKKLFKSDQKMKKFLAECKYDEIKSIINDNQLCTSDKLYSQTPPKIKIEEIDGKRVRSLGNDYFLVEEIEKEKNKSTAIASYYLANKHLQKIESPLNCKLRFCYDDKDRIISISDTSTYGDTDILQMSYEGNKIFYKVPNTGEILEYNSETKNYEYNMDTNNRQISYIKNENNIIETEKHNYDSITDFSYQYKCKNQYKNQLLIKKTGEQSYEDETNDDCITNYFYDTNGLVTAVERGDSNEIYSCHRYFYDFEKGKIYIFEEYVGVDCVTIYDMTNFQNYLVCDYLRENATNGTINDGNIDLLNLTSIPTDNIENDTSNSGFNSTKGIYKYYGKENYGEIKRDFLDYNGSYYTIETNYNGMSGKVNYQTYSSENTLLTTRGSYTNGNCTIMLKKIDEYGNIEFTIQYDDDKENIHYSTDKISINLDSSDYSTFDWKDASGNSGNGKISCHSYMDYRGMLVENLTTLRVNIDVENNSGNNTEFIDDISINDEFIYSDK